MNKACICIYLFIYLFIYPPIYPFIYLPIYLFGVLRRFQHCTGHITTGSWKGRGKQYIQLVNVLYYKLPTNSKQLKLSHLHLCQCTYLRVIARCRKTKTNLPYIRVTSHRLADICAAQVLLYLDDKSLCF